MSFVSKQFKQFQGKSAQTPGKADPTTREETFMWWAEQKDLTHAIFSANCGGESFWNHVVWMKMLQFWQRFPTPQHFHFSLFSFPQRDSFLTKSLLLPVNAQWCPQDLGTPSQMPFSNWFLPISWLKLNPRLSKFTGTWTQIPTACSSQLFLFYSTLNLCTHPGGSHYPISLSDPW